MLLYIAIATASKVDVFVVKSVTIATQLGLSSLATNFIKICQNGSTRCSAVATHWQKNWVTCHEVNQ